MISFGENYEYGSVPKIYMLGENSFKVWTNLRRLSMDFGRVYFAINFQNNQVYFWVGMTCVLGLWATFVVQRSEIGQELFIELRKIQFTLNMLVFGTFLMFFSNLATIVKLSSSSSTYLNHLRILRQSLDELSTQMRLGNSYIGGRFFQVTDDVERDTEDGLFVSP